jgi:rSAM/selenodomain-associated transferase 1
LIGLTNHLVIFSKLPRLGIVKTRLAKDIGIVAAWAFARQSIINLSSIVKDTRWRCSFAITPDKAINKTNLWPKAHRYIAQGAGDLGERMARVIKSMPPGPVVIIGTDIPTIRPQHVAEAFLALGKHDAVFGPSKDGGYWLVGIKRRPVFKEIFKYIKWSEKTTLEETISNLPIHWNHKLLETLEDIDEVEAFDRWKKND